MRKMLQVQGMFQDYKSSINSSTFGNAVVGRWPLGKPGMKLITVQKVFYTLCLCPLIAIFKAERRYAHCAISLPMKHKSFTFSATLIAFVPAAISP